jgi:prepilin-type N-terminal cleavage/methylation domain-containing protein
MKSLNKEKGFTLIEIVIVLAIAAGLIVVVLLAVAGANKSSRDTKRVAMVGQLASQLEQYANNNNGRAPGAALSATYLQNITDPTTGSAPAYSAATATAAAPSNYSGSRKCGTNGAMVTGTAAMWAISYWSESGGVALCKDNQ